MHPVPLPPPIWVNSYSALNAMLTDLGRCCQVAVDTESNSLFVYREQVCLIQFSTVDIDYLVDPFALTELGPVGPVFANPNLEKIFHAAEYDIIGLKRDYHFTFANLFDTMAASRILGRPAVGLGSMIESEFEITLNKHYQRANWGQRPLTPQMIDYARMDTHFLLALRDRLEAELRSAGRWELALEDFRRLCDTTIPVNNHTCEADGFWRLSGAQDLEPRKAAVLRELFQYRDNMAQTSNQPPFRILGNDALLQVAQTVPRFMEELHLLPGMSARQVNRHGRQLLEAVQRGLLARPLRRPPQPRQDERLLGRLEKLRRWRKVLGQEWHVESDVILPRDVLQVIAEVNPASLPALETAMSSTPWRFATFGAQILAVLK